MPVEIVKDSWSGSVRTVTLGATAADGGTRSHTVTVGGEKTMPFMHFEQESPNRPMVAIEIKDHCPEDWSPLLLQFWVDAANDPAIWDICDMALAKERKEVMFAQGVKFHILDNDHPT